MYAWRPREHLHACVPIAYVCASVVVQIIVSLLEENCTYAVRQFSNCPTQKLTHTEESKAYASKTNLRPYACASDGKQTMKMSKFNDRILRDSADIQLQLNHASTKFATTYDARKLAESHRERKEKLPGNNVGRGGRQPQLEPKGLRVKEHEYILLPLFSALRSYATHTLARFQ